MNEKHEPCRGCGEIYRHLPQCKYNAPGVGLEVDDKRSRVLDSERGQLANTAELPDDRSQPPLRIFIPSYGVPVSEWMGRPVYTRTRQKDNDVEYVRESSVTELVTALENSATLLHQVNNHSGWFAACTRESCATAKVTLSQHKK